MNPTICNTCALNPRTKIKPLGEKMQSFRYVVALAGNPNTGKSTIFNALTGLKQHTGNWSGKTVTRSEGGFSFAEENYKLVDLPGTYSLLSTSQDEEIARNFILFEKPDVTLIIADATRLERNLNLVLQILEITNKAVLCVNLLDEAKRNGIEIDTRSLSRKLGIPVVGTSARRKEGIAELVETIAKVASGEVKCVAKHQKNIFQEIDFQIEMLKKSIEKQHPNLTNTRWLAMRLLEDDPDVTQAFETGIFSEKDNSDILVQAKKLKVELPKNFRSQLLEQTYAEANEIYQHVVIQNNTRTKVSLDARIDRIVTSRKYGFLIMVLVLSVVLWITIIGANYPSSFLNELLVGKGVPFLKNTANFLHFPSWLSGILIDGVYLATAWVVSVMLPPMAIFFPLFTLLEDFGYLPRVAFNMDNLFKRVGAHGKQALTMTMGFGCNASGVIATRIIDSPRERLIAIITNNFSLCNGRWPLQILLATLFLGALVPSYLSGFVSIIAVATVALLGVGLMFGVSFFLSKTLLKGEASNFHLELPPYRPPQFLQTLYTSFIDRTLVVLWRAVIFSAPAGAVIWLLCNISVNDMSIATHLVHFLDNFGLVLGLNGVILLAYLIAIPANEIVIPTILMLITMVTGNKDSENELLLAIDSQEQIKQILIAGGWTLLTAVNVMIFSLLHNPCSTTIYTIYKETNSIKWTAVATFLPIILGFLATTFITLCWHF